MSKKQQQNSGKLITILIDDINVDANYRKELDDARVNALAESIKEVGLMQPIGVMEDPNGGYKLVYGKRRLLAMIKNKAKEIDARVFPYDEARLEMMMITENIQREKTSVEDEVNAIINLSKKGYDNETIAKILAMPIKYVRERAEIDRLPKIIQENFFKGYMRWKDVDMLLSIPAAHLHEFLMEYFGYEDEEGYEEEGFTYFIEEKMKDEVDTERDAEGNYIDDAPYDQQDARNFWEITEWQLSHFLTRLKANRDMRGTTWDPKNEDMSGRKPAGVIGKCEGCSFWTKYNPLLQDIDHFKTKEGVCTNAKCFDIKYAKGLDTVYDKAAALAKEKGYELVMNEEFSNLLVPKTKWASVDLFDFEEHDQYEQVDIKTETVEEVIASVKDDVERFLSAEEGFEFSEPKPYMIMSNGKEYSLFVVAKPTVIPQEHQEEEEGDVEETGEEVKQEKSTPESLEVEELKDEISKRKHKLHRNGELAVEKSAQQFRETLGSCGLFQMEHNDEFPYDAEIDEYMLADAIVHSFSYQYNHVATEIHDRLGKKWDVEMLVKDTELWQHVKRIFVRQYIDGSCMYNHDEEGKQAYGYAFRWVMDKNESFKAAINDIREGYEKKGERMEAKIKELEKEKRRLQSLIRARKTAEEINQKQEEEEEVEA